MAITRSVRTSRSWRSRTGAQRTSWRERRGPWLAPPLGGGGLLGGWGGASGCLQLWQGGVSWAAGERPPAQGAGGEDDDNDDGDETGPFFLRFKPSSLFVFLWSGEPGGGSRAAGRAGRGEGGLRSDTR